MFSRSSALLIGYSSLLVGFLFGNIFLIIAGSLIAVNETVDAEND